MPTITKSELVALEKKVDANTKAINENSAAIRQMTENMENLTNAVNGSFKRIEKRMDELPATVVDALREPVVGQQVSVGRKESRFPKD